MFCDFFFLSGLGDLELGSVLLQVFVVRGDGYKLRKKKKKRIKFN